MQLAYSQSDSDCQVNFMPRQRGEAPKEYSIRYLEREAECLRIAEKRSPQPRRIEVMVAIEAELFHLYPNSKIFM